MNLLIQDSVMKLLALLEVVSLVPRTESTDSPILVSASHAGGLLLWCHSGHKRGFQNFINTLNQSNYL